MELKLEYTAQITTPLAAIIIKGENPIFWIQEIERMGLTLADLSCYAVPNLSPNSVWGCVLLLKSAPKVDLQRNEGLQLLAKRLLLPEHAKISPALMDAEIEHLFKDHIHLFHPVLGLIPLEEPVQWASLLEFKSATSLNYFQPYPAPFIPSKINSFSVYALPPEEVLKEWMEEIHQPTEPLPDKPLNFFEKIQYYILKIIFRPDNTPLTIEHHNVATKNLKLAIAFFMLIVLFANKKFAGILGIILILLLLLIGLSLRLFKSIFSNNFSTPKFGQKSRSRLQNIFAGLAHRNQNYVDKLSKMLKENPLEALKYAIPLDEAGTSRGANIGNKLGGLSFFTRWFDFSLFGSATSGAGGGTATINSNSYYQLQQQYQQTARQLIEQGAYEKAAFVYLKLLKNPILAAKTLEEGKFYNQAASLYLKQNLKVEAARCYKAGNMHLEAIALYKELALFEVVGDLYMQISQPTQAHFYYEKRVDELIQKQEIIQASNVYLNKMYRKDRAQEILFDGWENKISPYKCLQKYLHNLNHIQEKKNILSQIYHQELDDKTDLLFLDILKDQFKKTDDLKKFTQEMAYQIISKQAQKRPRLVANLKDFKTTDHNIQKDIIIHNNTLQANIK